jgi:uncharacterized protein with GYD domain
MNEKYGWIRQALIARGYKAVDLARAWGVSESSTSRFLSGVESADPILSRCVQLAFMLGISVDDLAKGMGFKGKVVIPTVDTASPVPSNTMNLHLLENGNVRLTLCQDMPADKAASIIKIVSG